MTTINLLKKTALTALLAIVLVSCATVQDGMQGIQLGMSRQEVVNKLGKDYQVVSMVQTDRGGLEVLSFPDKAIQNDKVATKGHYILHFLDGKLTETHYENAKGRGRPAGRPR